VTPVVATDDLFAEGEAGLRGMVRDVETLVHAAWYAEAGQYQSSLKNLDCLAGTVRLAQAAARAGVRRFVGVGTCYEYDFTALARSGAYPIEPDAPLGAETVYGAAKMAAFVALDRALAQSEMQFAWCRLFYLYGAGEDSRRLLPYVLARLRAGNTAKLSAGTQVRDFLDVAEAGRQIARVAEADGTGPINICSGRAISVRDFILSQLPGDADLSLLHFGACEMRADEPEIVVGRPGGLAGRGWDTRP
jgi:dTDP-6-deoxy-L-talose 4-dehydrogenase (NAD+)